jgi:hypothetical protein
LLTKSSLAPPTSGWKHSWGLWTVVDDSFRQEQESGCAEISDVQIESQTFNPH